MPLAIAGVEWVVFGRRQQSGSEPPEQPDEPGVVAEALQVGVAAEVVEVAIAEFQGALEGGEGGSIMPSTA